MSDSKTCFVLVHGSCNSAGCWSLLTPHLVRAGHTYLAIDLPGHGSHAQFPKSYFDRPLNVDAFSTAASAMAAIPSDAFYNAVTKAVNDAKTGGAENIIVVGHSMAGVPITFAAERAASSISQLVYLCSFLMPPGKPGGAYLEVPEMSASKFLQCLLADPHEIGALRLDPHSADADYQALLKDTLAADVDDSVFRAACNALTPDAPAAMYGDVPELTEVNYGALKRHYIKCTLDKTIPLAAQELMIAESDAAWPHNPTVVHSLEASHSPYLSMPEKLADVLCKIAARAG